LEAPWVLLRIARYATVLFITKATPSNLQGFPPAPTPHFPARTGTQGRRGGGGGVQKTNCPPPATPPPTVSLCRRGLVTDVLLANLQAACVMCHLSLSVCFVFLLHCLLVNCYLGKEYLVHRCKTCRLYMKVTKSGIIKSFWTAEAISTGVNFAIYDLKLQQRRHVDHDFIYSFF
jgi:hypothetical protein